MEKGRLFSIIFVLLIITLLIGFVNAGWWNNFYDKITGYDTAASEGGSVGGSSGGGDSSGGGGSSGGSGSGSGSSGGGSGSSDSSDCDEGETKKHTCPDGTQVDWCYCSGDRFICIGSPENSCVSQTCSIPVCEGAYNTGEYDGKCPIYQCPPTTGCLFGNVKRYLCDDHHTEVDWCTCNNGATWDCINSPESGCPESTEAIEGEPIESQEYSGETCPAGCVCNGNVVACPIEITNLTIEKECPIGCICSNQTIFCQLNNLNETRECLMGCKLNNACVLPGIRTSVDGKKYCDIDSIWKNQKIESETCDNDYECETNLCLDGECLTKDLWQKILGWFKNLFS